MKSTSKSVSDHHKGQKLRRLKSDIKWKSHLLKRAAKRHGRSALSSLKKHGSSLKQRAVSAAKKHGSSLRQRAMNSAKRHGANLRDKISSKINHMRYKRYLKKRHKA